MTYLADRNSAAFGPSETPPLLRASDADRFATVMAVQDAAARGLLTPQEGSDRMATAFAAVYLRDLGPLTADLPPAPPQNHPWQGSARPNVNPPGWRSLAIMAMEQLRFSLGSGGPGRRHPVRVIVVLVLIALLVLVVGVSMLQLLFDGGPRGGGGPGPGRFGRP